MRYHTLPRSWKYELDEDETFALDIDTHACVETELWSIKRTIVHVRAGYRWDGPSGPTIDTETAMRGSLLHDVLWQAIEEGLLAPRFQRMADRMFRKVLREDGMLWPRRRLWWFAVHLAGRRRFRNLRRRNR